MLTQAGLYANLLLWTTNKVTYTTAAQSANALANYYDTWANQALAGGSAAVLSSNPNLISGPLLALPPFDISGILWATALETGLIAYWTAMTFQPTLGGPTTVAAGVPPVAGPVLTALLAQFAINILPGSTDATVAAGFATILFAQIATIKALVATGSPFLVPIL